MAKICVSSKALGDGLRQFLIDELFVHPAAIGQNWATLVLVQKGQEKLTVSCFCDSPFSFKFSSDLSRDRFTSDVICMEEQPITIEDGERLHVTYTAIYK